MSEAESLTSWLCGKDFSMCVHADLALIPSCPVAREGTTRRGES